MNVEKLNHLEERIEKPAYLLFLVIVLLFLIIGFVNFIDHDSQDAMFFGRYSLPYFGILIGYFLGMVGWASLLRRPNNDLWLTKLLDTVQQRPILGLGVWAAFPLVLWHMFTQERWLGLPAFQATVLVIMLLTGGLILFYRWDDETRPQLWRRIIVYLLVIFLVAEIIVQLLAFLGLLPNITRLTDSFAPYSRVYHTAEGHGDGITNSFGWYYPEFRLLPDSHRILIFGDSFIQALQVEPEQNLGILLEQFVNEDAPEGQIIEVLALGNPNYGPGLYLNPPMIDFAVEAFEPDEVITFFDLGSDFQTASGPEGRELYFVIGENGDIELHPGSAGLLHTYQHEVLHGYEGFQPVHLISSHYLTPRLVRNLVDPAPISAEAAVSPQSDVALPNHFVFYEDSNEEAMAIATGLIKIAHDHLADKGIAFYLVTIPAFTEAFYAQTEWNTQFGTADLLLPERALREFAAENDIPFLGLGGYLAASDTSPEQVQALYFNNGRGHFTPAGHQWAATAVYACFFAQTATPDAGCDQRGR
jgi:hypothetical protein